MHSSLFQFLWPETRWPRALQTNGQQCRIGPQASAGYAGIPRREPGRSPSIGCGCAASSHCRQMSFVSVFSQGKGLGDDPRKHQLH